MASKRRLTATERDAQRWRAFSARFSMAHHHSWDGKPFSHLAISAPGFITIEQLADRLRTPTEGKPND